jgi:fructose-1,6-bisphosphatase II
VVAVAAAALTAPPEDLRRGLDDGLLWSLVAATRAGALAAARWTGRGDPIAADAAATDAMRAALRRFPGSATIVSGEGAKDGAPMLADGELVGAETDPEADTDYDIAVDPLECTNLCARGLAGAMSAIALAPRGSLMVPGPAFYMDKLVLSPGARDAAQLGDPPEAIVESVARALDKRVADVRAFVLDKPRHADLVARLRRTGANVSTPTAGDVAGALAVLLPDGDADVLLGIGGTPEGVMVACAARVLDGAMQGRLAPQREDERAAVAAAGMSCERLLELEALARADGAFVATGVTGGLLRSASRLGDRLVTESIVIVRGEVRRIQLSTPIEE